MRGERAEGSRISHTHMIEISINPEPKLIQERLSSEGEEETLKVKFIKEDQLGVPTDECK